MFRFKRIECAAAASAVDVAHIEYMYFMCSIYTVVIVNCARLKNPILMSCWRIRNKEKRKSISISSSSRIQDEYYNSSKFADDDFGFFFHWNFRFSKWKFALYRHNFPRARVREKCHEMTLTKPFIIDKWQSFFILPSITYTHTRARVLTHLTTSAFYNFVWKLSTKYNIFPTSE